MKLTKLRWRAVLLVAVFALIAAACGDDDDTSTPTDAPPPPATDAPPPATDAPPPATDAPPPATDAPPPATTMAPMVCEGTVGTILPITGPVAFIGEVQLNWAKFALDRYNAANGTNHSLIEGDNMFDVAQSSALAAQVADNQDILAVVGPAGSDQVDAAGAAFEQADPTLAFVSPSSTRIGITDNYTGMFRTVPTDADQGPSTGQFMVDRGATKVFVIDDQSSYSTGLADEVIAVLEAAGVEVIRESVAQDVIDFSALVGTIPDDTSFVYLPWQVAANGQILGNQMAEQGKNIQILGSDGMDSGDFTIAGSIISAFAPDIANIPASAPILADFLAEYPDTNTFGPPVYVAVNVILEAIDRVCASGNDLTRANVLAEIQATDKADSILGQPIAFKANGDLDGGRFFFFEIQEDGSKTLIG